MQDLHITPVTYLVPGMDSLDHLTLNSNHMTHLKGGMFEGLTSLKALYIDHNQISTINREAFKGLEGT